MLKICFAGLGSIGQRHLINIVDLLESNGREYSIDAVRTGRKELPANITRYIHQEYDDISQLPNDYDVFFVTNPTSNHLATIKESLSHTCHMFIEKPVFSMPYAQINDFPLKDRSVYYVACPLRYSPCFKYIKKIINNIPVFSVRCISSSYLPDWRKGADYRKIYSADKAKGGGVTLDLIHELDYLTDLFGMPEKSVHLQGKYSDLDIKSDDLSVYILQYKDKLIEVHLDYFGREIVRRLDLLCKDYVIKCDFIKNEIRYVFTDHEKNVILNQEDMYKNEMRAFFSMINGTLKNVNSLYHANEILSLAMQESR